MLALLSIVLASQDVEGARYLMSFGGVPSGVVSFTAIDLHYGYRASHVFRSTQKDFTRTLELDPKLPPETWWVSTLRPLGCTTVVEERTLKQERVCFDSIDGDHVRGRIGPDFFDATYDHGALASLDVSGAHFERSSAPLATASDPFAAGFEVGGGSGALILQPDETLEHVEAMTFDARDDESCLEIANRAVKQKAAANVVLGVVIENGRAWPHAWVHLQNGSSRDPSGSPAHRMYVAFPQRAGIRYLQLLAGSRRFVRLP